MEVRRFKMLLIPAGLCLLWTSSCGSDMQSSGMNSYKETKTMVLDILKTKEGQKAIKEASQQNKSGGGNSSSDGKLQMLSQAQGAQLEQTVKDVLSDPKYSKKISDVMKDPRFAADFAKALSKENKQLQKDLMKDPEYQKMLIQVMKDPEFEKIMLDTLKGKAYRQQSMTIFKESLDSPLFKAELITLMKKAIEEESKPSAKKIEGKGGKGGNK